MLIKPAFVLTAGHVVGIQDGQGSWVQNPLITTYGTKVCNIACTCVEDCNMLWECQGQRVEHR